MLSFVAALGLLPITPCMRVRSGFCESDCNVIVPAEYGRFGMRLFRFRDGFAVGSSRRPHRCLHPRRRMIQYSIKICFGSRGRGVLDAPLSRGMTAMS